MKTHETRPATKKLQRRPLGRYRYVRLRWRIAFAVIDALGAGLFGLARVFGSLFRPVARLPREPRTILLVQLDHLGDAVLTTAILPALRRRWPKASLEVLASRSNRELFAAMDEVDRVHVCHANRFARTGSGRWTWPLAILSWAWFFRRHGVDLGIDVRGDFPVALLLWLCGASRRVGWACGGGGFLLTDVAPYLPDRAEVASRWALLETLDVRPATGEPIAPRVRPSEAARRRVAGVLARELQASASPTNRERSAEDRFARADDDQPASFSPQPSPPLGDGRPLVVVHLGAGTPAKQWPLENWSRLIHWLRSQARARVVLVGGPDDRLRAAAIVDQGLPDVLNWTGRCGIEALAALLEQSQLMIGADSGPAHLAAAVGTSAVVLFSGTNDAWQWRPTGSAVRVLRHAVSCSPCHRESCPVVGHPCMRGLSPLSVAEAVQPLLPPGWLVESQVEDAADASDPDLPASDYDRLSGTAP